MGLSSPGCLLHSGVFGALMAENKPVSRSYLRLSFQTTQRHGFVGNSRLACRFLDCSSPLLSEASDAQGRTRKGRRSVHRERIFGVRESLPFLVEGLTRAPPQPPGGRSLLLFFYDKDLCFP